MTGSVLHAGPQHGRVRFAVADTSGRPHAVGSRQTFFYSASNELLIGASVAALLALAAWRRRRRAPGSARAVRALLFLSGAAWALGLWAYGAAEGPASAYVGAWEISVVLLLATGVLAAPRRERAGGHRRDLAAILLFTLATRLWGLDAVPPRIHDEEITEGLQALDCRVGSASPEIFGTLYSQMPLLGFAVHGLLMKAVGDGLWGHRFATVLFMLAAVAATYLLAAELIPGRLPAAAAALFVSFHHVTLYFSRTGHFHIDGMTAVALTAWLVVRCLRGEGWPLALLAGAAAGVLVQGYWSARVAPILALVALLSAVTSPRELGRRQSFSALGAFLLAFVIALGPLLLFFASSADAVGERERLVLAFRPWDLLRGERAAVDTLAANLRETVRIHTFGMDADGHYGGSYPYLHPLLWPVLLLGAWRGVRGASTWSTRLVWPWLAITLGAGSALVKDPLVRRTMPAVIAFGLLLALGVEALGARRRMVALFFALLALAGSDQLDFVWRRYPRAHPADLASAAGSYLHAHTGEPVQLFTPGVLPLSHSYVKLMAPRTQAVERGQGTELCAGTVLLSALHAATVSEMVRASGSRLEMPWGAASVWNASDRIPSYVEARVAPPAIVRLAAPPPPLGTVELLGSEGSRIATRPTPLLAYEYDRSTAPLVRKVVLRTVVHVARRGACGVAVQSHDADATVVVDGRMIADARALRILGGRHLVEATFTPRSARDSLQLVFRGSHEGLAPPRPAAPHRAL